MKIFVNKGRNRSLHENLNYLSQKGKIYVMDNHLAAFWCWAKELDSLSQYSVLHIDRHHDLSTNLVQKGFHQYKGLEFSKLSIEEMIMLKVEGFQFLQWDNYFEIFKAFYPQTIKYFEFVTQENLPNEYKGYSKLSLNEWMKKDEYTYAIHAPDIINLDIDVFFAQEDDKILRNMFGNDLEMFAQLLKPAIAKAKVVTIALSPECCGGWPQSLEMFNEVNDILDLGLEIKI